MPDGSRRPTRGWSGPRPVVDSRAAAGRHATEEAAATQPSVVSRSRNGHLAQEDSNEYRG
jgi:hypothetical protein